MESGGGSVAALAMDCEDMFKEITKKLYGEETVSVGGVVGVEFPAAERDLDEELRPEEHITAWGLAALMQNGFPPPGILQANFTPRTDPTAEDRWTAAEEPLAWAHSRIAAYNPAQRLFKCAHCDCVGFLARLAEHWLGTHSQARAFQCPLAGCGFASSWARGVRTHLARDHHSDPAAADQLLRDNPALDDLTRYLQRLKNKVESMRNDRRATPGDTAATTDASAVTGDAATGDTGKRYACAACPYATDRRDLFTRHENIHRDEKPFHCYLCQKQFNRADHVKKHFLRMHRDQPYDLNRIRRMTSKAAPAQQSQAPPQPQQTALHYYGKPPAEPPPAPVPSAAPTEYRTVLPAIKVERAPLIKAEATGAKVVMAAAATAVPVVSGGGGGGAGAARRKGERRFACCYCAWSGVDNWCLKRHLNTHLKPFACALCEYKAARAERLATHVHKVHNKKSCGKCSYLADDQHQLAAHLREAHHIESRNLKVPTSTTRGGVTTASGTNAGVLPAPASGSYGAPAPGGSEAGSTAAPAAGGVRRRAAGAARLFGYLEASDGSGDEFESGALPDGFVSAGSVSTGSGQNASAIPAGAGVTQHYTRDKENAAPLHHAGAGVHHDHCLRY